MKTNTADHQKFYFMAICDMVFRVAGDSFATVYQQGMKFSTYDQENHLYTGFNCAGSITTLGGWEPVSVARSPDLIQMFHLSILLWVSFGTTTYPITNRLSSQK